VFVNENEAAALARIRNALVADLQKNAIPEMASLPVMAPLVDFNTGIIRIGISHPLMIDVVIGYMTIGQLKAIMSNVLSAEATVSGASANPQQVGDVPGRLKGRMA
jgi:hypothetical protein